jgi:glutaredoxin 2
VLSKIFGNLIRRTVPEPDTPNIQNLPKHLQVKMAVDALILDKTRTINLQHASRVKIQCISPNILSFTDKINGYREKLLSNNLAPTDCFADFKVVSLDEFFTDEDGMYIATSTINEFTQACTDLFTVINNAIKNDSRDASHILRLLNKCFISIQNVCDAFETRLTR